MSGPRRAAFLDRDGTLIEDTNFLADANRLRLLEGAPDAVRILNERDVLTIVVTNQSGIGRGLISEAQYEATRARLVSLMDDAGARIDATFHCPHFPEIDGPCECRKPGTLLYRRAAEQFGIDLSASLYAGDRDRDITPGLTFGGFARLVPSPSTPEHELNLARERGLLATSLGESVAAYIKQLR